jgi:hypothetical protein
LQASQKQRASCGCACDGRRDEATKDAATAARALAAKLFAKAELVRSPSCTIEHKAFVE